MDLLIWLVREPLGLGKEIQIRLRTLKGILRLLSEMQEWITDQKNSHSKWIQQIKVMICSQLSI